MGRSSEIGRTTFFAVSVVSELMAQSPRSVVYMDPHLFRTSWGASAIYSEITANGLNKEKFAMKTPDEENFG